MIKCNIDFNLKSASIFIDDNFIETKSFNDLSFKKETSVEFKNCNDLYLINKISIYLKIKYNAKEIDTLFIINNENIYNLLKPNNILIKKLTKSMKRDITNNELKLILGSTLFEMNSIKNIDLILREKENVKGDESMFDNDVLKNNFNLKSKKTEFNLDGDFDFNFDLETPIESIKNNDAVDLDGDFNFDLDDEISIPSFDSNSDNIIDEINTLDLNEVKSEKIVEGELNQKEDNRYNSIQEDSIKNNKHDLKEANEDNDFTSENPTVNDLKRDSAKNKKDSKDKKAKKHDDLKTELLKEFEKMENYIDEQIISLEKQSKNLEDENSKLKLNLNDLNIDEEIIIENFNKSMEIRLRLKVIKKSCKIYNNIKTQLKDELSKF